MSIIEIFVIDSYSYICMYIEYNYNYMCTIKIVLYKYNKHTLI